MSPVDAETARDVEGLATGIAGRPADSSPANPRLQALISAAPLAIVAADLEGRIRMVNALAHRLFGYEAGDLEGSSVERLIPERLRSGHLRHRLAFADDPRQRPMGPDAELLGLRKDGSELPIEAGLGRLDLDGERLVLVSLIDLTRHKEIEAELEERVAERTAELEQRRRVAASLRDTLRVLNSDRSLDEILEHVVGQARDLLAAPSCALYRYRADLDRLEVRAHVGRRPETWGDRPRPGERAVLQSVRQARPVSAPSRRQIEAGRSRILAVPLILQSGERYGALELCLDEDRDPSEEEIGLAVTLADQAALAVENARLRRQATRSAVAAERNRIARDLHDSVTQTLFSASMIAEVLPRLWKRDEADGRQRLEELRQLTRGALAEMRSLLLELRPRTIVEVPLEDLLVQLGEATAGRARLPIEVRVEARDDLPDGVKEAFYRIAQESLNNVAKHARARRASVVLGPVDGVEGALRMEVRDDGRSFDPHRIPADHFGLNIMRERAEAIGADLNILTRPGRGTTIEVVWPSPEGGAAARRLTEGS